MPVVLFYCKILFNKLVIYMTLEIILSSDDIKRMVPYQIIGETRYSSIWDTSKRRRLWNESFSKEDEDTCEKLFRQARRWFVNGVTESARFTLAEYEMWDRLTVFCISLLREG